MAGLFRRQAKNLALKQWSGWDLALLRTPPLPLCRCSLEPSLPRARACLLLVGTAPWAASHCRGMGWLPLAAAQKRLTDGCGMVLAPGGTLGGRRSNDPKPQAAIMFPASSLQRWLAGAWFIASRQHTDGFHTPALGVFMDLLPVKRAGGCIPWAPVVLQCSGSAHSPCRAPGSFAVLPCCRACPPIDRTRAEQRPRASCTRSPSRV